MQAAAHTLRHIACKSEREREAMLMLGRLQHATDNDRAGAAIYTIQRDRRISR